MKSTSGRVCLNMPGGRKEHGGTWSSLVLFVCDTFSSLLDPPIVEPDNGRLSDNFGLSEAITLSLCSKTGGTSVRPG